MLANYMAHELRLSRAMPPGRAAEDDVRRRLYGSALQQMEELLRAAEAVGPASQPLLLFYALSQGGRAILAAHGDVTETRGHGLSEVDASPEIGVLHRKIRRSPGKKTTDTLSGVLQATAGQDFAGEVELGAVWAALPGVHRLPADTWQPEWRPVLDVIEKVSTPQRPDGTSFRVASWAGNPLVAAADTLSRERYPMLHSDAWIGYSSNVTTSGWFATINLPGVETDAQFDLIAPEPYGGYERHSRALIPTLPGQSMPLTPLALWWLLLFGLSIFARYHPDLWSRTLDVQRSTAAVPLEALMGQAVNLMPALIYSELFAKEHMVARGASGASGESSVP